MGAVATAELVWTLEQERLNESISPVPAMTTSTRSTSYDSDFYAWTQEQAKLLRQGQIKGLDLENLAEEIESLGKRDFRAFVSAIRLLTQHLLKWQYQPKKRSNSWLATIDEQRFQIALLLKDNPSFQSKTNEAVMLGYRQGRRDAARESDLPLHTFPETCPYSWEQLTDEDWLPD
jgi:hypothetical protein